MAAPTAQATGSRVDGFYYHWQYEIPQADLIGPRRKDYLNTTQGYAITLAAMVDVATGASQGTLTFKNETTNTVLGVITIPASTAKGTKVTQSIKNTNAQGMGGTPGPQVNFGDDISITPAGFTTSGAVTGFVGLAVP